MRASAVVVLGAVSLWLINFAAPAGAGTLVPGEYAVTTVSSLKSQAPSSFASSYKGYSFEGSDPARVVAYDDSSCKSGDPTILRGSGGGGGKKRHSAPTTKKPCGRDARSDSTVTPALRASDDPPTCSDGRGQPSGRPSGGDGGKKRHSTPMGQVPCGGRQGSPTPSKLSSLSMSIIPAGTQLSFGLSDGQPDASTGPGGGGGGKHRHSPPTPPPPGPPRGPHRAT